MGWQTAVIPGSTHYWLIHPETESLNFLLHQVIADAYTDEYEESVMNLINRGRKVDYGNRLGYTGSLTAQLRDITGKTARQQRIELLTLKAERRELILRNPFGDLWQIAAGNISIARLAGVGQYEYVDVTMPYLEVV